MRQSDGAPTHPPQWEVRVFSVENTIALVRRCRQEKTSLDRALFAAAAGALRAVLPASESRFKLRFPIDIRGQLDGPAGPVTKQDLGCFVSAFEEIYAVDFGTTFWPLARQVHRDVRAFIEAGGPSLLYDLARFHRLRFSLKGLQRGTLHSSVLGVAPLEGRYGSLNLEECAQVYKNDRGGASINLVAITVQLRLNLTMHAGGLQEKFWERFREEMVGQLRRAIAELGANGFQAGESVEGTREQIAELVHRTVDEVNEELEGEAKLEESRDSVLYGQEATIDSMTFVSFIVAAEENIRREYGLSVTLANEKAMSSERSPFKTLGSMIDYRDAQETGRPRPHEQRGSLRQGHQRMDPDSGR